jgi:serine protease AprX
MNATIQIICPLCNDTVDKLLYRYHIDSEKLVIERLRQQHPAWTENDGVCGRCLDYYHTEIIREQRILPEIGPYFPVKSADDYVILPTGLRLDADPRFTGKGVTICFIDSDFYPHPDLTAYSNRVKAIIDITAGGSVIFDSGCQSATAETATDAPGKWHGTMTSVVCAGDGYLSNGLYKGIASDAHLVLLKVQNSDGHISRENIIKALQWILQHHASYGIRIVNMSLGDDEVVSYKESEIDRVAEALIAEGITVVAAVGNDENGLIKPPANGLHVIAVGGIDDDNQLNNNKVAYHSTFGRTTDALMKPELVAHAIWIAAPVLPGTREQKEAVTLYGLVNTADKELVTTLQYNIHHTQLDPVLTSMGDINYLREAIVARIQRCKYIAPHYMHADGTSFAAPIVCSVIAQLLEVNPLLSPSAIRNLLFSTAKRIDDIAAERQGFGIIQPRKALLQILNRVHMIKTNESPYINRAKKTIEFTVNNTCASQIALAGSFNHWAKDVLLMEPHQHGWWKIEIPLLPAGKYQYKFLIDEQHWIEDTDNPFREPDGVAGFNSVLLIEN